MTSIADRVVEQIRAEADLASHVAAQLGVVGSTAVRTVGDIVDNDEYFAVEFKSTARWDLREVWRRRG